MAQKNNIREKKDFLVYLHFYLQLHGSKTAFLQNA